MNHTQETLLELTRKLRYDTTAIQAKISELATAIAALNLPDETPRPSCPTCGIQKSNAQAVLEHRALVHQDPAAQQQLDEENP
jgi:hypothetical protein